MAQFLHPEAKALLAKHPSIKMSIVYPRERLKEQFEKRRDPSAAVSVIINAMYRTRGRDGRDYLFYDQTSTTKDKFKNKITFNEQVGKYDNIEIGMKYNPKNGDLEANEISEVFEDYTIPFSAKAVEDALKGADRNSTPKFYVKDGFSFTVSREDFVGKSVADIAESGKKAIAVVEASKRSRSVEK